VLTIALLLGSVLFVSILKMKTSFFILLLMNLYFVNLGMLMLYSSERASLWSLVLSLCATLTLTLGYYIGGNPLRKHAALTAQSSNQKVMQIRVLQDQTVYVLVIAVSLISAYHLLIGGIPILSNRVESVRFNFNSSGLLGIPGRVFLYGPTFAWVITAINANLKSIPLRSYRPFQLATFTLIACALASGFKGDLLSLTVLFLGFGAKYGVNNLFTFEKILKRYSAILAIPIFYFFLVATRYRSYKLNDSPLIVELFERLTLRGSEPGSFALNMDKNVFLQNFTLLSDFQILISKYLGIVLSDKITLERFISIKLLGWDKLTTSYFTPPVTIGIFPEFYYFFGIAPALIFVFGLGFLFKKFERYNTKNTIRSSASIFGVLLISSLVIKGAFAYHFLNIVVLYTLGLLFVKLFDTVSVSQSKSNSNF
jgi:hypothetical protein